MKRSVEEQISTLNYIDGWAKQVKIQAEKMLKLYTITLGADEIDTSVELDWIKDEIGEISCNCENIVMYIKRAQKL